MSKSKSVSGGAKLMAAGKRPILIGVSPEQHDTLRAAADAEQRPITQYVLFHALRAAQKTLAQAVN